MTDGPSHCSNELYNSELLLLDIFQVQMSHSFSLKFCAKLYIVIVSLIFLQGINNELCS